MEANLELNSPKADSCTSLYSVAQSRDALEEPSGNAYSAAPLAVSVQWRMDSGFSAAHQESHLSSTGCLLAFWAYSR